MSLRSILSCLLAAVVFCACSGESEFHQTSVFRPSSGLQVISGEGGRDSLVFATTESFTITTTSDAGASTDWFSFPNEMASFNNNFGGNALVQFSIPLTFERNEGKSQRKVTFTINASDYSASVVFLQDTIHATADTTAIPTPIEE